MNCVFKLVLTSCNLPLLWMWFKELPQVVCQQRQPRFSPVHVGHVLVSPAVGELAGPFSGDSRSLEDPAFDTGIEDDVSISFGSVPLV